MSANVILSHRDLGTQRIAYFNYISMFQLLIGFGSPVIHGIPQDETVITLTGLTGPAGISLRYNGFIGVIIGPILVLSSGQLLQELLWNP